MGRVRIPEEKTWHREYLEYLKAVADGKIKAGKVDAAHGMYDIGWNACIEEVKHLNKIKPNKRRK